MWSAGVDGEGGVVMGCGLLDWIEGCGQGVWPAGLERKDGDCKLELLLRSASWFSSCLQVM